MSYVKIGPFQSVNSSSATRLGAAIISSLAVISCNPPEAGPKDFASRGGYWAVQVAGLKLGQTCQSAHREFADSKWVYSTSYTQPPPNKEEADGGYEDRVERVDFQCIGTTSGPRVSSITYRVNKDFRTQDELLQETIKKLGAPPIAYPSPVGYGNVYIWGKQQLAQNPDIPRNAGPTLAESGEPYATLRQDDSSGDSTLRLYSGSTWSQQQQVSASAAKSQQVRSQNKSIF